MWNSLFLIIEKSVVTNSTPTKFYKSQPEPFVTSTIQQAASNQFHFSPKETMKICQKLYEITYDS